MGFKIGAVISGELVVEEADDVVAGYGLGLGVQGGERKGNESEEKREEDGDEDREGVLKDSHFLAGDGGHCPAAEGDGGGGWWSPGTGAIRRRITCSSI